MMYKALCIFVFCLLFFNLFFPLPCGFGRGIHFVVYIWLRDSAVLSISSIQPGTVGREVLLIFVLIAHLSCRLGSSTVCQLQDEVLDETEGSHRKHLASCSLVS